MKLRSLAAFLIALSCFLPVVEPNVSIGGAPKSLFIAACDVDVTETVKQLSYICQYHRVPSGQNQTIKSLALLTTSHFDAAASTYAVPPTANDALCWDKLKPLIPYFPGGNGPCTFDNVYVGQLHINEANPPGQYVYIDAMANTTFVDNLVQRSVRVAQHFKGNVSLVNPNVKWDWYLSQEHFFEFTVYNQGLNDGWVRYISKLMIGLNGVLPNRQFLWSPAFAYNAFQYTDFNPTFLQILDNAKNLFLRVQGNVSASIPACASAATCPFWVSPQDYVGSYGVGHLNNTMHSAGLWMKRLKSVYPFTNFSVNVEQFNHNWWNDPYATKGNMYFNADCLELQDREAYYTSLGFSLGPAYAMHMWYGCNHPDDGSYCDAGWTKYNQFCYRLDITELAARPRFARPTPLCKKPS
ncbi:hypothetical protein AAVH_20129 [Aphelenchoides avenae]|nr:hypothetical protein AAVH_20129 [Aphelenchus avenae]